MTMPLTMPMPMPMLKDTVKIFCQKKYSLRQCRIRVHSQRHLTNGQPAQGADGERREQHMETDDEPHWTRNNNDASNGCFLPDVGGIPDHY